MNPSDTAKLLKAKITRREANQTINSIMENKPMTTSRIFSDDDRAFLRENKSCLKKLFVHREAKAKAAAPELLKRLQSGEKIKLCLEEQRAVIAILGGTRPAAATPSRPAAKAPAPAATKPAPAPTPPAAKAPELTGLAKVSAAFSSKPATPSAGPKPTSNLTGYARVAAAFASKEKK